MDVPGWTWKIKTKFNNGWFHSPDRPFSWEPSRFKNYWTLSVGTGIFIFTVHVLWKKHWEAE
jgi:hypothetical protein